MTYTSINKDVFRDKVHGCWTGKNIGGTLGGPYEMCTDMLDVKGYSTPPGKPMPNDDLDLQLVWLKAVQERGPLGINSQVLGEYWLDYITPDWNEYGICKANMRAGLPPPICGEYGNEVWKHSNGAWIRSEIWACLAPGCPDVAIKYAYEDACVDHGGGEGMYAALFTTAIQSAAFVVTDRDNLINIGLSKIPEDCRVAKSVRIVLKAHAEGISWQQTRQMVVEDSADLGWFQAPANIAFAIIGWMYGEGDFGKSIIIATNCGDDADCTAATLGATLGIILGRKNIPDEWTEPIGDQIVTIAINSGNMIVRPPDTCEELTKQVVELVPKFLSAHNCPVIVSDNRTDSPSTHKLEMADDTIAREIWSRSPYSVRHDFIHMEVTLDYEREPRIIAGKPFPLKLMFKNRMPSPRHLYLKWHLPEGWKVLSADGNHIHLKHGDLRGLGSCEAKVDIVAEGQCDRICRGILEIVAEGRPTVGLIPLVFYPGGSIQSST